MALSGQRTEFGLHTLCFSAENQKSGRGRSVGVGSVRGEGGHSLPNERRQGVGGGGGFRHRVRSERWGGIIWTDGVNEGNVKLE